VCDRIISPLKGAIRRYCDEGHDILSASDMYVALQARPVTGTTAAVCELNRRAISDFKLNRVSSFSTFHNFMYEAEGLRISKAYNIGTGNLIPWSELNIQGQCPITLDELDGQGFNTVPSRNLKFQVPSSAETDEVEEENTLFQCKEAGCSHAFNKFEDLEDHICIGEHDMETNNQDNLYDQLRREWALKFSTVSFDPKERLQPMKELSERPIASEGESITAGWALQKPRGGRTRFSESVKSYLTDRFDIGVQTGRKSDPLKVSVDMRQSRNVDGSRKFTRSEWLTKGQVQAFFSRLSALRRKHTPQRELDEDDENDVDDLLLEEEFVHLNDQYRSKDIDDVLSQVGVMHPIIYDGYDICQQVKSDTLSHFNVKILKTICNHFELPYKSRDTKASLMGKISDMVQECSCS